MSGPLALHSQSNETRRYISSLVTNNFLDTPIISSYTILVIKHNRDIEVYPETNPTLCQYSSIYHCYLNSVST